MTASPNRAPTLQPISDVEPEVLELSEEVSFSPQFDSGEWAERRAEAQSAGGRHVLGTALTIFAALWLAYTAWSAGRSLGGQPLSSPQIAQWVAVAAGPLALLGLVWLMFGRTRRKETERFTRSVIAMRAEAQSLEALLEVLSQRIADSHQALAGMAERMMILGDQATDRLDGITRQLDSSSEKLAQHGSALDRAAEAARNDIAVLLEDLPRAETTTRQLAEQLRAVGAESAAKTAQFGEQVERLAERTADTDRTIGDAVDRLAARLAEIDSAGGVARDRVGEAETRFSGALDALLDRTSATLDDIRSGIDAQAAAVAALVGQASAGIGKAGADASAALAANVDHANSALEGLSTNVAEQERASQRMIAEIDRGLTMIDQRFTELAAQGDERANHFLVSLTRARGELDALGAQASSQDDAIGTLAERTAALRENIDRLAADIRENVGTAIGEAQGGADRLSEAAGAMKPEIGWVRDAAVEAGARMAETAQQIAEQQDRLAALLASVDDGVTASQSSLGQLGSALMHAQSEAANLSAETGPALIAALVQVKEAAVHAAERAREAIETVIPDSASRLSEASREALERVIRESIEDRLREVEVVAARAVDAAKSASDRLSQQMLNIGQSAAALEQHINRTGEQQRERESEGFARRVSLLIDSMHSAAIDVGKILSDEIDDKAWESYLKGNRGVFTRRAVRLMDGSETRAISTHYEGDAEFQRSVNRYVHDFEAMLRRVLAERDGGMIAVTLMSSDMGKLYAALAPAIDKRR
jgi:ABC-type transporter Mla subunit MlaD